MGNIGKKMRIKHYVLPTPFIGIIVQHLFFKYNTGSKLPSVAANVCIMSPMKDESKKQQQL